MLSGSPYAFPMVRLTHATDFNGRSYLLILGGFAVILYLLHSGRSTGHDDIATDGRRLKWTANYDTLLRDVRNKTLGFEKIFVITMPTRPDHRDMLALAGAVTPDGGLELDIVDGVMALPPQYRLPPWGKGDNETGPQLGPTQKVPKWIKCWRAHMDVLRQIVDKNIASAIIAESDFDWDVNIKNQMQHFAKASSLLLHSGKPHAIHRLEDVPSFSVPKTSAYGDLDRWDILWLGHCGMSVPPPGGPADYPRGRVAFHDPTVPERSHLRYFQYVNDNVLQNDYPDHTRLVHWANRGICQSTYAVSQRGARKMLFAMGVNQFYAPVDLMTRDLCDTGLGKDAPRANCVSVQPPLFMNHRPAGPKSGFSDIDDPIPDFNYVPVTRNIRFSTKMNLKSLVLGSTELVDQWPDTVGVV